MITIYPRFVAVTLFVSGTTLALLLLLTHSVPLSETGIGLAMCDVPCWAGIEPGRTHVEDALDLLNARIPQNDLHLLGNRIDFRVPLADEIGRIVTKQGDVIRLQVPLSEPLWQTVLTLGKPWCIQFIDRQLIPEAINVYWAIDDVLVMSSVNLAQTDPTLIGEVVRLWVSPPESPCAASEYVAPWPGYFALK